MTTTLSFDDRYTLISVERPDEDDLKKLKSKFNLHPVIVEELASPSHRSKVEAHDEYLFFVSHLPVYSSAERTSRRVEIDFIATSDTLVAVTYEKVDPFEEFKKELSRNDYFPYEHISEILYAILQKVNEFSLRQLRHIEEKVHVVGKRIFKDQDRALLEEISYVKRDLLDFAMIAVPQRATLGSLFSLGVAFWGPQSEIYFSDLIGDFEKVTSLTENLKATIESYSETVSQIFQLKTSEVVRRFSIIGVLTFPLILYTTIALQPKVEASFLHDANDFWLFFGIITLIVVGIALSFRRKGWL